MCAIATNALGGTIVNARFYLYCVMTFKVGNASCRNIALNFVIFHNQASDSRNNGGNTLKSIHDIKAIFIFAFEQLANKPRDTAQLFAGCRFGLIIHSFCSSQ